MRALVLLAAASCAGCALLTATPPEVEVQSVALRAATPLDQELGVVLCVTNPNTHALEFRSVRVALDAAGAPLLEGVSDTAVRLPPQASVAVPFTVATTIRNVPLQLATVFQTGRLDYRLRGAIALQSPALTVPFSRSGRLDLLQAGQGLLDRPPSSGRCPPPA